MKDDIVYKYNTFNKENWNYNVDKIFLVIFLSLAYTVIRISHLDYNISTGEMFLRMFLGPFNILFFIAIVEGTAAVLTKIALEPGIILESKLLIIPKVFFKSMCLSYQSFLYFKQVTFIKEIRIPTSPYIISFDNLGWVSTGCSGKLDLPGYVKIPEHFK